MTYPGSSRWLRMGSWLVAVALSLAFGGFAHAAPLAQPASGIISGTVISADNVPLANIELAAFDQPNSTQNRQALVHAVTDAQGNYTMTVPAGSIWVSILTQDIAGQSFWGYDDLPVTVAPNARVLGVDFRPAIRVVATVVPTPAPAPTATAVIPPPLPPPFPPAPPPGMPSSGGGPSATWALVSLLGLLLVGSGAVLLFRLRRDKAR